MKLITYQSIDVLKDLVQNGYFECDKNYIDIKKMGKAYSWVINKMNLKINNKYNTKYPIWCWIKCYNKISPSKRKGKPVEGFDIKITFNKNLEDIFITDFRRYSFLLNNTYIPNSKKDKELFDEKLKKLNITNEELEAYIRLDKYESHRKDKEYLKICDEIEQSFDRCITTDSDILQGCIWRINISDIEKIEFLTDKTYRYGSLNYIRSNGKRFSWINDFYKKLK